MPNRKEYTNKKINELAYSFKVGATLSILALKKNDIQSVILIHNNLKCILNKISSIIIKFYGDNVNTTFEDEKYSELPKELSCLRIVDTFKKFLSYEYINLKTDNIENKILLNKMCIEFNPFDDVAFINLAELLLSEKKYNEALAVLSYLEEFSQTPPIYSLAGDIYRDMNKLGAAIENYLKYLSINKKDSEIENKLNKTYEEILS